MSDDTYNGWRNYETWNIALWMDNEYNDYKYWQSRAADHLLANEMNERQAAYNLADEIKETHEEYLYEAWELITKDLTNGHVPGWMQDISSHALALVDWDTIAKHKIDDAVEAIKDHPNDICID